MQVDTDLSTRDLELEGVGYRRKTAVGYVLASLRGQLEDDHDTQSSRL